MEAEETAAYEQLQKTFQDKYIFFRLTLNSLNFGQQLIQTTGLGTAMVFAAIAAANGKLTPGDFVLINSYVIQLFQPLFFLGSSYNIITQAATDVEKCVALLKTEITVQDTPDAVDLVMPKEDIITGKLGTVSFNNVTFRYQPTAGAESGGLKNITFTVRPGKMIAFVGASGAGKRYPISFFISQSFLLLASTITHTLTFLYNKSLLLSTTIQQYNHALAHEVL